MIDPIREADARPLPDFYDDLGLTLAEAWRLLAKGVEDRRHAFHTAALATIGTDSRPHVRTVVLRSCEEARWLVRFHTDRRTRKVLDLRSNPQVGMLFYDAAAKIQLRVAGIASLQRENQIAEDVWRKIRPYSRLCYRQAPAPGQLLDAPDAAAEQGLRHDDVAYTDFCVVEVAVSEIEWLYLATQGHRRARFIHGDLPDAPMTAMWVAP